VNLHTQLKARPTITFSGITLLHGVSCVGCGLPGSEAVVSQPKTNRLYRSDGFRLTSPHQYQKVNTLCTYDKANLKI
jgi:hypothetical protein